MKTKLGIRAPFSSQYNSVKLIEYFALMMIFSLSFLIAKVEAKFRFMEAKATDVVQFTHGVASGDVRTDSNGGGVYSSTAVLWTRVNQPATIMMQASKDPNFGGAKIIEVTKDISADADYTVKVYVKGFDPGSTYYYRFIQLGIGSPQVGYGISETGQFKTPPAPDQLVDVHFAWSGDSDFNTVSCDPFSLNPCDPVDHELVFNHGEMLTYLAKTLPQPLDFFVYAGDTIYSESFPGQGFFNPINARPSTPPNLFSLIPINVASWDLDGVTHHFGEERLTNYRDHYKQNRIAPLQDLMASTSSYVIGDDHEVLSDYSGTDTDPDTQDFIAKGRQAFHEYMPIMPYNSLSHGDAKDVRWGKGVELFVLDTRSFRSPDPGPGEACSVPVIDPIHGGFLLNPETGQPIRVADQAPLLPATQRNAVRAQYIQYLTPGAPGGVPYPNNVLDNAALSPFGGGTTLRFLYLYLLNFALPANQPASDYDTALPIFVPGNPTPIFGPVFDTAHANPCASSFQGRTFLGHDQFNDVLKSLGKAQSSGVIWKVVVTPDPMLQRYMSAYDSWEGFPEERSAFLSCIKNGCVLDDGTTIPAVKNVVFLAADFHENIRTDIRMNSLDLNEDPVATEFVAGPIAELTSIQGEHQTLGMEYINTLEFEHFGVTQFFNANSFGYGRVYFNANDQTLTVSLEDENGDPIPDMSLVNPNRRASNSSGPMWPEQ